MKTSTFQSRENHQPLGEIFSLEEMHCSHCGGNGYMKTNPNCYHTCLKCLGRGLNQIGVCKNSTSHH